MDIFSIQNIHTCTGKPCDEIIEIMNVEGKKQLRVDWWAASRSCVAIEKEPKYRFIPKFV